MHPATHSKRGQADNLKTKTLQEGPTRTPALHLALKQKRRYLAVLHAAKMTCPFDTWFGGGSTFIDAFKSIRGQIEPELACLRSSAATMSTGNHLVIMGYWPLGEAVFHALALVIRDVPPRTASRSPALELTASGISRIKCRQLGVQTCLTHTIAGAQDQGPNLLVLLLSASHYSWVLVKPSGRRVTLSRFPPVSDRNANSTAGLPPNQAPGRVLLCTATPPPKTTLLCPPPRESLSACGQGGRSSPP